MPRGKPKASGFDFTIRYASGARVQWTSFSERPCTDAEIAAAIRRYLFPIVERIESAQSADAVARIAGRDIEPTPRA